MKKYYYNIGWDSYEGGDYIQLAHEKRFTERELEEMIHKSFENILRKMKSKECSDYPISLCVEYMLEYLGDELVENFGFQRLEFTAIWECFGWANILDEKHWADQRGEELTRLTKYLHKRGYTKDMFEVDYE